MNSNTPLAVVEATGSQGGHLPADRFSAIALEGAGVMIEAVKKAEDENALVVRLYETSGASAQVTLQVNLPSCVGCLGRSDGTRDGSVGRDGSGRRL